MNLYHFTRKAVVESILKNGINASNNPFLSPKCGDKVVSLTSDLFPQGHGLTTGKMITREECPDLHLIVPDCPPDAPFIQFQDLTEVRLTLTIPKHDPRLISYVQFCKNYGVTPLESKSFVISANFPHQGGRPLSDKQLLDSMKALKQGKLFDKSRTWYLYLGDIDPAMIAKVEEKQSGLATRYA
jgi:hypothetical protein